VMQGFSSGGTPRDTLYLSCTVKIRGSFQPKKAGFIHPKTWGILAEKPGYLTKWSYYPNWGISPTYPMNSGVLIVEFQPSLPQIFVQLTPG